MTELGFVSLCIWLLIICIIRGVDSLYCPSVSKFVKLDSEYISWPCVIVTETINTSVVTGSSLKDIVKYARRECTKSCMVTEECYIVEAVDSLECKQCRAENKFLWKSEMMDYYNVFGTSSTSYVKLDSYSQVQLGHGECLYDLVGLDLGGDEFHMSPTSRNAKRLTGLVILSLLDNDTSLFSFAHRIALEIGYDDVPVEDYTAITEELIYDTITVVSLGPGQRIDKFDTVTADGLPVDVSVIVTDGANQIQHGPFFSDLYSNVETYHTTGVNLRSIYGLAGRYLEKLGVSFDDC